jgi:UTP--glucose-1-phosphate uridylyltransferase
MPARVRKAVFPVGGMGTRFLPATKAMPKEMLPVVDKPLIQYAVEEARAAGIEQFIFVTGRGKSAIEDHFDHSHELTAILQWRGKQAELAAIADFVGEPGQVAYVRQQEPLGLGHAVWCARHLVGEEPFAVLLADDLVQAKEPCLKQMIGAYQQIGGNLISVMEVPQEHTNRYGILRTGAQNGRLIEALALVEKPAPDAAPSRMAIIGRYILQPQVFALLEAQSPGTGGEIQLTDALSTMCGGRKFHGYAFDGVRFDCGDKAGFVAATIAYALQHPSIGASVRAWLKDLELGDGGSRESGDRSR